VSHPIPLHPDADLALVLDEMRQSVAAWGDEGMVMRVFRAGICLALLSILDTLIELLADFRAGRLPPVLPARDRPAIRTSGEPEDQRTAPPPPADAADAPARGATRRPIHVPDAVDSGAASADVPGRSAAECARLPDHPSPAPPASAFPPRHIPLRHRAHGPRRLTFHPSHVPRPSGAAFWRGRATRNRVHFVTFSIHSDNAISCLPSRRAGHVAGGAVRRFRP
jgi:hypothetical protein